MSEKLTSDSLTTDISSDCCFIIDESLNDGYDVGILCANIDYETAL